MTVPADRPWPCPPRIVVAAVDFEDASARAASLAGYIASAVNATLRVVHAEHVEAPPYFTPAQMVRLENERAEATAGVTGELKRFARAAQAWPAQCEVRSEAPVDAILQTAAAADLLVLGTHGRRGPSRWWLGSVAERVVRAARVPVLVTRADAAPLAGVFDRVVLMGDGVAPEAHALDCVRRLLAAVGGTLLQTGLLGACGDAVLAQASLVAIAAAPGRSSWGVSHTVAEALGRCGHPALFLPPSVDAEERS